MVVQRGRRVYKWRCGIETGVGISRGTSYCIVSSWRCGWWDLGERGWMREGVDKVLGEAG
jgi:hypothetical protein